MKTKLKSSVHRHINHQKYFKKIITNDHTTTTTKKIIKSTFTTNNNNAIQEYSVQLTFREQWTDERLKFDDIQGLYYLRQVYTMRLNRTVFQ